MWKCYCHPWPYRAHSPSSGSPRQKCDGKFKIIQLSFQKEVKGKSPKWDTCSGHNSLSGESPNFVISCFQSLFWDRKWMKIERYLSVHIKTFTLPFSSSKGPWQTLMMCIYLGRHLPCKTLLSKYLPELIY